MGKGVRFIYRKSTSNAVFKCAPEPVAAGHPVPMKCAEKNKPDTFRPRITPKPLAAFDLRSVPL